MAVHLLFLAIACTICGGQDINYETLSGFGPYLIDYSSEMLANMLPLAEMKLRTGGDLTLSDEEFEVEKYMRQQRNYIIFQYNADGPLYKYLDYERINLMRSTKLYELLKEMPKGANLHLHLKLAGDYKPLLEHLWDNYRDRLYVNSTGLQLSFENKASSAPLETFTKDTIGGECKVSLDSNDCRTNVVQYFLDYCTFGPGVQKNLNENSASNAWSLFEQRFGVIKDVLDCVTISEWYMANVIINQSASENVDYLELRTSLDKLYTINGTNQTSPLKDIKKELIAYKTGLDEGNRLQNSVNNRSVDATLIPTARKEKSSLDIQQAMADASMAWNYWKEAQNDSNSNLIRTLGFDLVGQEDVGYSWDYQNTQNYIFGNASKAGQYCPIHAGETNWGTNLNREVDQSHVPKDENAFSPDRNLLTAIQNSDVVPRVGHGLALAQHPMWIEAMRARGQCVVVMMLSNQMLQYVQDLRRHPLSAMINSGLKVALSTDDPAMFQINFNDEFIAAFISADLDLAALKAMIINSYDCSLLSQDEKDKKIKEWTMKWDNFINANVPTARSYDPCVNVSQADCYKVWNDSDEAAFRTYKSFHSVDSDEDISAQKSIACEPGKKFVIPQATCIPIKSKASHLHVEKKFALSALLIILTTKF